MTRYRVSTAFQKYSKREKKSRDEDCYTKFDTKRRGKGVHIYFINSLKIKFTSLIIATKLMCHFSKNECTLDTISTVENCTVGAQLN